MKSRIVFIFVLFFVSNLVGQNLDKYHWKNRILLVFTDDKNDDKFLQQVEILARNKKGLAERKLKVYQFCNNQFSVDFSEDWIASTISSNTYKRKSEDFKIVLIGLDGGVKLNQSKVLSTEKLFTIIDGMPMRRSEIKYKN